MIHGTGTSARSLGPLPLVMAFGLFAPGLLAGTATPASSQSPFPHETHEHLFPLCEGCHGPDTGDPADLYPDPAQCASCHDGDQAEAVEWSPPEGPPDYRHPDHEAAAGIALTCGQCHDGGGRTALAEVPSSCGECHEEHHEAGARCRVCHSPSPRPSHERAAHRGCGGQGCHQTAWARELTFDRELCLVCHQDLTEHRPGRPCAACHAVGQPGG